MAFHLKMKKNEQFEVFQKNHEIPKTLWFWSVSKKIL